MLQFKCTQLQNSVRSCRFKGVGQVRVQDRQGWMKAVRTVDKTVDKYFSAFPKDTRILLEELRKAIRAAAPDAEETISYHMPAFKWNGMLVWYAGFKKHVGFYPKASAIAAFRKELAGYKTSKGTIQFPIEKRIPVGLVKRIVKFRLKENERRNTS